MLYSDVFFRYDVGVLHMFLHTFNPNPILAHLGSFTIHWYGLFLALGALAGYVVFIKLGQRYGLKGTSLENLSFIAVIAGLVGARLYHVLNEWSYYAAHPNEILSIWNGGLAIHGALIAGLIVFFVYARRKKMSFWLLTDIAVPALALGQAIGRWGNYFNQELYGRPTSLPWGIPIEPLNRPLQYMNDKFFQPTFLYESLGSLAVFVLMLYLHKRLLAGTQQGKDSHGIVRNAGFIALVYFIVESLVRAGTELLRIDRVPSIGGVRLPLLVSLAIAIAAGVILFVLIRRRARVA